MPFCAGCPRKGEPLSCGSRGPDTSKLAIVGMAPGADELATGLPFKGSSGRILARAMIETGLNPSKARILNVINCPPSGGLKKRLRVGVHSIESGAKITKEQFEACSDRLCGELRRCPNLKVVVALGAEAFQRLTGLRYSISEYQNHPVLRDEWQDLVLPGGVTLPNPVPPWVEVVIPLYHPAYIQYRGMKDFGALKAGFERVKRALRGEMRLVSVDSASVPIGELATSEEPIAFDIETDGIGGPITRIGFATRLSDQVVSGSYAWVPKIARSCKELLEPVGRVKIAHNAPFDIGVLRRYGVEVASPVWDTMWAHQLLNPDLEKSLDAVSGFMLDVPHWKHLSKAEPAFYNRMDAHITLMLYELLRKELSKTRQLVLFERTIMPALATLERMTAKGLRIDVERAARWRSSLEHESQSLMKKLQEVAGREINLQSWQQLSKLLYEDFGLPLQKTREGKVTTNKDALSKLEREVGKAKWATTEARGFVLGLREYKGIHKLLATYAQHNGATVHPSYFPVGKDDAHYGTATGRLSSQNPNIQNQPKAAKAIYIPHGENNVLVEADYSQIELRIIAWLAGEAELCELFLRGADIHEENRKLFDCDRTRAKNLMYGTAYGAGPRRLAQTLRAEGYTTTLEACADLQNRFFDRFKRVAEWRDRVVRQAKRHGFAENAFGRRRYFFKPEDRVPEVINFHPQSNAADILLDRLPAAAATFEEFGGSLLTTVHDSVVGEVPRESWRDLALALRAVLEKRFEQIGDGFWCPVDVQVGLRWSRLHRALAKREAHA